MPYEFKLSFTELCAFVPSEDLTLLRVLLPTASSEEKRPSGFVLPPHSPKILIDPTNVVAVSPDLENDPSRWSMMVFKDINVRVLRLDREDVTVVYPEEGERVGLTFVEDTVDPAHQKPESTDEARDFGWVVEEGEPVRARPDSAASIVSKLHLFDRVALPAARAANGGWLRITDGRWVRAAAVRVPRSSPPPAGLAPDECWIDIDLASQTLVAYVGARPVFATLVSTGIGRPGSRLATPPGAHRVRAKHRTADMDNLEHQGVWSYYSVEDVPWVQWITRGVALHGAFWHRRFGHPQSHGCVNLAPLDAERLFGFTSPALPDGAESIAPDVQKPGPQPTIVRVR